MDSLVQLSLMLGPHVLLDDALRTEAIFGASDVGIDQGDSVAEILAVTGEVTGRPIPAVRNPPRNEPRVLISDHARIGDELGWSPARSALREIIADAWSAVSRT